MHPTTSLPPRQLLDHVGFRDWIATRAGFYFMPDGASLVAVALDRGGPLRITKPLSGDPLPLTIIEVLAKGRSVTGLDVARTVPAVSLTTLRKRRGGRRLVLETELQRKRLLPRWLDWLQGAAESEDAVLGLDLWALKHLRSASFAELAYMAGQLPTIGSRMLWALVRADAGRAVELFLHWTTAGEHTRLHGLGDTMIQIVEASVDSPYHAEYLRLVEVLGFTAAHVNARRSMMNDG